MASYIEAGALLMELNDTDIFDTYNDYSMVFDTIDNFPIADVEPVRHGHWIEDKYGPVFECSECGYATDYLLTNYCPECGAKMDGKENDNDQR